MQSFRYEYTFRAPSTAAVLGAYFDSELLAEQDRRLGVVERTVLEDGASETERRRVCRIVPRRQLPLVLRTLLSGPLHYTETAVWRTGDDTIAIDTRLLSGRASITATYRVALRGSWAVHRVYEGFVSVDIALVSARIERGIIAEFERSLAIAAACTQEWLDRVAPSCRASDSSTLNPGNPSGIIGS
jgi:hypothetical protein